jgi:NAD(P)H-dependent FMN reductase
MAKIALIVGSVRRDRQGIKVARWMNEKLKDRNHLVFFIDPLELKLPLLPSQDIIYLLETVHTISI